MIFLKSLVLFFVFLSPVYVSLTNNLSSIASYTRIIDTRVFVSQLKDYELMYADFNMGEKRFTIADEIHVVSVEDKTFKLMFSDGCQTFQMWDFVTLLGVYVEFDTLDSDSADSKPKTIRCVFQMPSAARDLYSVVKPKIETKVGMSYLKIQILRMYFSKYAPTYMYLQTKFPLLVITQLFELDETSYTGTSIHVDDIGEGNIFNELRNRFIVVSRREKPAMIFSSGHFNVSPVLAHGQIVLVIQVYDIEMRNIVMLKFLLIFKDDEIANNFHKFVKQEPSCTNDLIPVTVPSYVTP